MKKSVSSSIYINSTKNGNSLLTANAQINKYGIFTSSAKYIFNGEQAAIPSFPAVEKNLQGKITRIQNNKVIRKTEQIQSIEDEMNVMKGGLADIFKSIMHLKDTNKKSGDTCTQYRVIDMAIAYDSTFCDSLNGKENAEAEIQSIISLVSDLYRQDGVCLKVEISYLEGFCDVFLDPYDEILKKNEGVQKVLDDFREYWNENRTDVNRTVAHLFTATRMQSSVLGTAYTGVACRKRWGYSVEEVTWSERIEKRAGLVAHELGHNMGADHVEDPGCAKFIMNSGVSDGSSGFHSSSVESIGNYIENITCMRIEAA